jgi:hypothetical protein
MATYCFICTACGETYAVHAPMREGAPELLYCSGEHKELVALSRDFRAEKVGLGNLLDLKHDREGGGPSNMAQLFLPENEDFAGPDDPEGKKGMREWRDKHRPKSSNKKPLWPGTVERKVF